MPRVIGIDIPNKKQLLYSLQYIYGLGPHLAKNVIRELGLDPTMIAEELTQDQIAKLNGHLQDNYMVEGDLRRFVQGNIQRLIRINCYRGQRHRAGLPVRGQRTRCNARTRKGKKKTIANKKK